MNDRNIYLFLESIDVDEILVDKLITSMFIEMNKIKINDNIFLKNFIILTVKEKEYLRIFENILKTNNQKFSFELLIDIFEYLISPAKQQTNGAVYTPKVIKDFIIKQTTQGISKPLNEIIGADIACGCGAFLYSLALKIHETTKQSIVYIIENQLFGLDISESSIQRAKILLTLLTLSKGEDKGEINFNLYTANSLDFDWNTVERVKQNGGFDIIVGNPPYVRAKNLDPKSKKLLKNWQVTKTGNPDLYIPFFEIGLVNLATNGKLGYITVNSFYRSMNARSLRIYFEKNEIQAKIIDFGHEQIFANKLTYTCLCFLSNEKSTSVQFAKSTLNSLDNLTKKDFTNIPYNSLNSHRGWLLNNKKAINNIQKIENCGTPLGELFTIKNGLATLSNHIYIFKPIDENKDFFFLEKDGKQYKIEKGICRDIIKPNILKHEHEIPKIKEQIIYPYTNGITPLSLMKESFFENNFPNAYQYLENFKELLSQRDKGNGDYGAWFAFGRTQALADKGLKLMFPYIAKDPHFVYTDQKDMLIYCGYAIFSNSEKELLVLKKLLQSEVFNYYMQNTSKPYASGYYSYAKNYVKNFGVCDLSEREKIEVLNLEINDIDAFFKEKYRVKI
jgi:adenine-specific DNA-methyltransferase